MSFISLKELKELEVGLGINFSEVVEEFVKECEDRKLLVDEVKIVFPETNKKEVVAFLELVEDEDIEYNPLLRIHSVINKKQEQDYSIKWGLKVNSGVDGLYCFPVDSVPSKASKLKGLLGIVSEYAIWKAEIYRVKGLMEGLSLSFSQAASIEVNLALKNVISSANVIPIHTGWQEGSAWKLYLSVINALSKKEPWLYARQVNLLSKQVPSFFEGLVELPEKPREVTRIQIEGGAYTEDKEVSQEDNYTDGSSEKQEEPDEDVVLAQRYS